MNKSEIIEFKKFLSEKNCYMMFSEFYRKNHLSVNPQGLDRYFETARAETVIPQAFVYPKSLYDKDFWLAIHEEWLERLRSWRNGIREAEQLDRLDAEMTEVYAERPRRKPDSILTGRLQVWQEEGQYHFDERKPHPEMKREVLHERNGVKLSKSAGKKESSYQLTASCSGDVLDPEGLLMSKLIAEIGPRLKKEPRLQAKNFLIDKDGKFQVWQNKTQKTLNVYIALDATKHKELLYNELFNYMTEINRILNSKKL